jgi:hypothetical protein
MKKVVMKKIYSFAIFLLIAFAAKAQQGSSLELFNNGLPLGTTQYTGKIKMLNDSTNVKLFANNIPNSCLGKTSFEVTAIPNGAPTINGIFVKTVPNPMAVDKQLNVYKLR